MNILKNYTPYQGKIKLKIEKSNPYYSGGGTKLNKFYFKIGPYYISSRIHIKQTMEGESNILPGLIEEIELKTDGKIGTHRFGPNNEYILENSFLSPDNIYIGSIDEAWWYLKNNMRVEYNYPRGVARKYDKFGYFVGYYGYSHRGGNLFKIGDKLFDETYKAKEEDYEEWQWDGWKLQMEKDIETYRKEGDEVSLRWVESGGIDSYIPFKYRGSKTIENWNEALQAAINISKYLS